MNRETKVKRSPTQAQKVCHFGSVTFLTLLLAAALFAAPQVATYYDFAHAHADGAPEHVHPIGAVLVSSLSNGPAVHIVALLVLVAILARGNTTRRPRKIRNLANSIRAPPLMLRPN